MITMTSSEMLALWRRALGFENPRNDCTIEGYEGIDIDAFLSCRMRQWYLNILDTAPASMVPVADMAGQTSLTSLGGGWTSVALPSAVRRVLAVKLSGWENIAVPVSGADAAAALRRMASPFGLPGPCRPLAVRAGNTLRLYPAKGTVERLEAVVDPGPATYTLDESFLTPPT